MKIMPLIIFPAFLFCLNNFGQSVSDASLQKKFDEAIKAFNDSNYQQARELFSSVYHLSPKKSPLHCRSLFNQAVTCLKLQEDSLAESILKTILSSFCDDREKGGRGGLMGDPYSLYKHNTCEMLSSLALKRKNFTAALFYTNLSDRKYPYRHFCGNAMETYRIYQATAFAEIYIGLKDTATAISYLIPHLFNTGLADNSTLVNTSVDLIRAYYPDSAIRNALDAAITLIDSEICNPGKNQSVQYFTRLFGKKLPIPDGNYEQRYSDPVPAIEDKSFYATRLRTSNWFKKLVR